MFIFRIRQKLGASPVMFLVLTDVADAPSLRATPLTVDRMNEAASDDLV